MEKSENEKIIEALAAFKDATQGIDRQKILDHVVPELIGDEPFKELPIRDVETGKLKAFVTHPVIQFEMRSAQRRVQGHR